jgi:RimJ/RimL family protein N-acetyltransferase
LATERLLLRPWRAADREPFARLNDDPEVMEHFVATLSRAESDALAERIERDMRAHGYGLWAVELVGEAEMIGFVGLVDVDEGLPCAPAIEIGWRLARAYWGRGLACEGARAALAFAFGELGLDEVVATTTVGNRRSRKVMERLGMRWDPDENFEHPLVPAGHRLRRHVLYRLRAS